MEFCVLALGLRKHGIEAVAYNDPAGRHSACLAGGCVWKRLARLEDEAEGFTAFGRLLHAYYMDLAGICSCPQGRSSRRI